jgi:hypothetical protein
MDGKAIRWSDWPPQALVPTDRLRSPRPRSLGSRGQDVETPPDTAARVMIPGGALHRLAGRMCSAKTLERVVEPAIADLQREYADGTGDRSALARLWALRGGYIAVL